MSVATYRLAIRAVYRDSPLISLTLDLRPVSKNSSANAPATIDDVLPQLLAVLVSETPVRLVKSGKLDGLFSSAGGDNKRLIAACMDSSPPLLERVGQSGNADPKSKHVRLTSGGLEAIATHLTIANIERAAQTAAAPYKAEFRSACLKTTRGRLGRLVETQSHLVAEGRQLMDNATEAIIQQIDSLNKERQFVEECSRKLDKAVPAARPQRVEPADDRDNDFLRKAADLLVFAWQDAEGAEARACLESVFVGLGIRPMHNPGTLVRFDGRHHQTMDAVEFGEQVVVSQPGWALRTHHGTVMLTKSVVRKQTTPSHASEQTGGHKNA